MAKTKAQKLRVMLSSTVYGKEPLIDQIYALLNRFGYKVWNSHIGSLPIIYPASTYGSCIAAVEQCDIFFGLISSDYGSGVDGKGGLSITHKELDKAIELEKPRFILAHEQVVLARRLMLDLSLATESLGSPGMRAKLTLKKGAQVLGDLRLIDMYEAATQEHLPIDQRTENWVQRYRSDQEVLLYVQEQFSRYADMQRFVETWRAKKGGA